MRARIFFCASGVTVAARWNYCSCARIFFCASRATVAARSYCSSASGNPAGAFSASAEIQQRICFFFNIPVRLVASFPKSGRTRETDARSKSYGRLKFPSAPLARAGWISAPAVTVAALAGHSESASAATVTPLAQKSRRCLFCQR
jgi:hypothetical protein